MLVFDNTGQVNACAIRLSGFKKEALREESGIEQNDLLFSINGKPVIDILDYTAAISEDELTLNIEKPDGELWDVVVQKEPGEQMGLVFESDLMSPMRDCCNHCVFCFVDQLPQDLRKTLYFKDDDWRLSFIMGNYVTLTNVGKKELERILHIKPSPLYVSVHATDKNIRNKMLGVKAPDILAVLKAFSDNKMTFHSQAVLCPEINTGDVLKKTAVDLFSLRPVCSIPCGCSGRVDKT